MLILMRCFLLSLKINEVYLGKSKERGSRFGMFCNDVIILGFICFDCSGTQFVSNFVPRNKTYVSVPYSYFSRVDLYVRMGFSTH